jgi:hypothetical protein
VLEMQLVHFVFLNIHRRDNMSFINKEDFANFNLDEFLSFKKMITPVIIKIVYLLGVVGIVLFSLYSMFFGISSFSGFLLKLLFGILYLILGNLMWRMMCELMMVIFNMLGELRKFNQSK